MNSSASSTELARCKLQAVIPLARLSAIGRKPPVAKAAMAAFVLAVMSAVARKKEYAAQLVHQHTLQYIVCNWKMAPILGLLDAPTLHCLSPPGKPRH